MRQLLQLHPHRHTGKVLHHKHTSYHALFLVVGLAGVFMVLLSHAAKAADYDVTARIPAPIPVGAPVITSPVDGLVTSTTPLTISGTCPVIDPAIIVMLHDGSDILGSGQCTTQGTFSVSIPLTERTYHIVATVMTITDDAGESSPPLTVTFVALRPPINPGANPPRSSGGRPSTSPSGGSNLEILSDKPFVIFGAGADAVWTGMFKGGTPPYRVTIGWGDGTTDIRSNVEGTKQSYSHHYNKLRGFQIVITITDHAGASISKTFAAATPLVFDTPVGGAGATQTGLRLSPIVLLYALYFSLLALLFNLWQQSLKLRTHPAKSVIVGRKNTRRRK